MDFVAFLKPEEAYVGCLLYRNAQGILDEAILSNLNQLLPSKFKVSISNFFLQVVAAWSHICIRKCYCSEEPFWVRDFKQILFPRDFSVHTFAKHISRVLWFSLLFILEIFPNRPRNRSCWFYLFQCFFGMSSFHWSIVHASLV